MQCREDVDDEDFVIERNDEVEDGTSKAGDTQDDESVASIKQNPTDHVPDRVPDPPPGENG